MVFESQVSAHMKIFGGILPFIGFRRREMAWGEAVDLGVDELMVTRDGRVAIEVFEIEWLGAGVTLAARPVA